MGAMAAKTGLSVLVMLLGLFQEGLTKLDRKDYRGAVLSFSRVISHPKAGADLRQRALVFQAIAHLKEGERDKTMRDLAQVMKQAPDGRARQDVFAALATHGGDIRGFLPRWMLCVPTSMGRKPITRTCHCRTSSGP